MPITPLPADYIELSVPLRGKFASTLRILIAALGADAGFSIDEIDDAKLAVTEVFSLMADDQEDRRVQIGLWIDDATLEVRMSPLSGTTALPDELARAILDAVVDSYDISAEVVTLTKCAVERAGNR
jgi:hypothetical protein